MVCRIMMMLLFWAKNMHNHTPGTITSTEIGFVAFIKDTTKPNSKNTFISHIPIIPKCSV